MTIWTCGSHIRPSALSSVSYSVLDCVVSISANRYLVAVPTVELQDSQYPIWYDGKKETKRTPTMLPHKLPYSSTRWGGGIAARSLVKFFSFPCDSLHLFHFWWCEKSLSPFSSTRDWQPIQGVPYPLPYDRWDRLQPPSMNPNWYLRKWMGGWIYATITMQD